ncbi:glutamate-rich WD repeat-containing protein 1-like isoform X2 [Symsagittifera roscoffensis]|uniref:glutamate-rich WD repeat-containing protein 1-like isoform X2 n=1 Tax=Symsagittifera roscoffensis TaxID=84072 RepID=UPI00307B41A3
MRSELNTGDTGDEDDDDNEEVGNEEDDEVSDTEDIIHEEYHESSSDQVDENDNEDVDTSTANEGVTNRENKAGRGVQLKDGELDMSVYDLFRTMKLSWPCLSVDAFGSFDPVQHKSPYTLTFVAGSQADKDKENRIYLFKCRSFAKKTQSEVEFGETENDSDSSSSDEDDESDADINTTEDDVVPNKKQKTSNGESKMGEGSGGLKHDGCCNRVRQSKVNKDTFMVASWSSKAVVSLYNVTASLKRLDASSSSYETDPQTPVKVYTAHSTEGYGLDWSPVSTNQIASGDCSGNLHVWELADEGSRVSNVCKFSGSRGSVEDIQWSPAESTVLSTCGTDSAVRIWDKRTLTKSMLSVDRAHSSDVNVIGWNPQGDPFIVSGGDDCQLKVWDLRQISKSGNSSGCSPVPVAQFGFHKGPITSVKWNPNESTQFAASSDDNTVSIWDLSLERDNLSSSADGEEGDLPAQLLFLHEGQQTLIKELTWHKSVAHMLLSSAEDGLHLLLPNNL